MGEFLIRPALVTDAEGIAKVRVLTWQDTYRRLMPDSFLQRLDTEKSTKNWAARIRDPEKDSKTIVALFDGVVVGYYESHGWQPTGQSKIDKIGDFELFELQYVIRF